ncbi:type IX secretion system protein PorQ [Emticicia oligotrophica]|nr:type IX secretion system protein PorQ [Emticicia oligotrophica]
MKNGLVILAQKIKLIIFPTLCWELDWVMLFSNTLKISVLSLFCLSLNAQNSFSFLNIPTHARVNGLGGINVSLASQDINFINSNPALLDSSLKGQIGLTYSPYLAQSHLLVANYSPKFKTAGTWAFSIQNLSYGTFQGTDAIGNLTNEFSANDFALTTTYARQINNITFGTTAKMVGSILESYSSLAFLTDWGGIFKHPIHDFTIGLVAKNVGYVLKSYGNIRPDLPFDLQIGTSFKPKYMPVRFSFTGHHLYTFNIINNNPNLNFKFDEQGNKVPKSYSVADKISRHFITGAELLFHKNFNLLIGYNFLIRKELVVNGLGGASGFSFGANLRLKKIDFCFSHAFLSAKGHTSFSLIWKK